MESIFERAGADPVSNRNLFLAAIEHVSRGNPSVGNRLVVARCVAHPLIHYFGSILQVCGKGLRYMAVVKHAF